MTDEISSSMQQPLLSAITFNSYFRQLVNSNDFLFIIGSTVFTNSMRNHKFSTFAAFY